MPLHCASVKAEGPSHVMTSRPSHALALAAQNGIPPPRTTMTTCGTPPLTRPHPMPRRLRPAGGGAAADAARAHLLRGLRNILPHTTATQHQRQHWQHQQWQW